jgi:diguanylate cyclase (GGDEF)-like protein
MKKNVYFRFNSEPEILNSFSRTLAEIEWLLLVLVLFYLVVGQVDDDVKALLIFVSCLFAGMVIVFQYLNLFKEPKVWKIAVQTLGMIFFISWVIWYTGKLESPLFNLYLLPIIASSITLGKLATLFQAGLICVSFVYLVFIVDKTDGWFSLAGGSELSIIFFPMVLVAYVASMLAADIQMGFNKLKVISETDELTDLYNLRTFNSIAKKMLKQAERRVRSLAILMIDADNLKQVNDTSGHEAGNLLLQNVAQCFNAVLRGEDVAARYGGDEFVILLSDCGPENAFQVAGRIIEEFKSSRVRYRGVDIELSASIGIACFPEQGQTLSDLVAKADQAMYFSKRQGKSLVTFYREGLDR